MKEKERLLGQAGELCVARYLEERDFTIIEMNFQIRAGEIDIIARKDDLLVCVEVKTRTHTTVPLGLLVSRSKQLKIIKTAQYFIQQMHMHDVAVRFDVAFVVGGDKKEITYIPRAFTA